MRWFAELTVNFADWLFLYRAGTVQTSGSLSLNKEQK